MNLLDLDSGYIPTMEEYRSVDDSRKTSFITNIVHDLKDFVDGRELSLIEETISHVLNDYDLLDKNPVLYDDWQSKNTELIDLFLKTKSVEGLSPRSIEVYSKVSIWIEEIGKPIPQITTNDLRNFLSNYQERRGISNTTLDGMRRYLSTFFKWCNLEGHCKDNPMIRIKKIKTKKQVKEPFTPEEIEKIREYLTLKIATTNKGTKTWLNHVRDRALIEVLLGSGARISEVLGLTRYDIDFNNNEFIVTGKGNKERKCYLTDVANYHLKKYLENRDDTDLSLFVNNRGKCFGIHGAERRLRELGKEAGGIHIYPHKFRRTFATNLLNKGVPIEQVQVFLGHSSTDTTMIYARVNEDYVNFNYDKYMN